jgi:hypothetical protein
VVTLLLFVHGKDDLWLIYLVTGLYGAPGQIYRAARGGLLHSMVPDARLGETIGVLSSLSQGLKIAGPLVGAGIYAAWGSSVVVLADIGTFAFSVASYLAVPAARVALSDRRQGKSCSSAAGHLRSGAAGTSPSAVSLAEHRVEFGVGPDLPDLLRAAAGDGDLGSPLQRLLA